MHARGAEVVFHVARALHAFHVDSAFELRKNLYQRLADDVGEHIQPPAMRHADHHFSDLALGGAVEKFMKDRDRGLRAFQ